MTAQFWILDLRFWIKNHASSFNYGDNPKSSNDQINNLKSKISIGKPPNFIDWTTSLLD